MRRRNLVAALAGLGLVVPGAVGAMTSGRGCYEGSDRLMRCGFGFAELPPIPAQPCRHLCWATCVAYLLRGYGAHVTEADVLARHGLGAACRPQRDEARIAGSSGAWTDRQGRAFFLSIEQLAGIGTYPVEEGPFLDLLRRLERQPVLCGAAGHTTVLAEISSAHDRFGRIWREGARVLDPYAPVRGMRALTEEELRRPAYVFGLSIRPV